MGKPISSVGGVSSPTTTQQSSPTQSVEQSPTQSPTQSAPTKPEPQITIWPPAYGYRRSATEGNRSAHNSWQEQWLAVGPKVTKGAIDSVAALKDIVEPLLQHGKHGRWS